MNHLTNLTYSNNPSTTPGEVMVAIGIKLFCPIIRVAAMECNTDLFFLSLASVEGIFSKQLGQYSMSICSKTRMNAIKQIYIKKYVKVCTPQALWF